MRKTLQNTKHNKEKLSKLRPIYLIAHWAHWGIREFYFYKFNKDMEPLVYKYNDHNGTADQYDCMPISQTTSGVIWGWDFNENRAKKVANMLNQRDTKREGNCERI